MTLGMAIEKRLEGEIARILKIMGDVRDRPEGLNEADTKAAFIDPILSVLGWELRDPFSASQQYRHKPQDNPVDYALFILRAPVLFVEAKALNRDLSDYKWIFQTLAYANAAGVEWCVLTNGDEYRTYDTFAKAEAEKKVFRRVRLSDRDERAFCVETLLLLSKQQMAEKHVLWKAHFVDRQVREAVSAIFREPDAALVRMIIKRTQDLQHSEVRESLRRADLTVRFPTTVSLQTPAPQVQLQEAPAEFKHDHPRRAAAARTGRTKIGELISAGVVSAPAEIEVTFKGQQFAATIEADGLIHFDGEAYSSPSHAGGMVRNKVNGPPPDGRPYWSTNGWTFWHYKDPVTGHPEPISRWLEKLG
jgi:predicted type IV restriction endonuclease